MILNPGTQHFDFTGIHIPIVVMSLEPTPASAPSDLSNNPAADTTG